MIELPGVKDIWAVLPEARIVGGAVRDSLVGCPISDVDFASPLRPDEVMARLRAARIKTVPTGLAHGTVTAVVGGQGIEITTLRRDVATDGRHATVAFTDDWREDASRRDFTINAMSAGPDGTVFDYFGGRADLAAGLVRFVGEAAARIEEDYLRIFRFFRFFARYGRGAADAEAVAAIAGLRAGVARLSAERVWSEVKKILAAARPLAAMTLMADTGVLEMVLPGARVAKLGALIGYGAPVDPILRVAALLGAGDTDFAARLKMSGEEAGLLAALLVPGGLDPAMGDDELRRALADGDKAVLIGRSWLAQDGRPGWDRLRARIAAMDVPVFPLLGRDVTALGLPPGPVVGEALAAVRAWWMGAGCLADRAACLGELRRGWSRRARP
jgi:poly(A) polymerase/tRNA nucleotidyltransferase (CCA-adding enzyme)